jgi:Meckel syndrome type 1 protein
LSAHVESFPIEPPYNRDLSDVSLWERSLTRSVHRRELAALHRKYAARRKGATIAVSATMAATPTIQPLAAMAAMSGGSAVATAPASDRTAIHMPASALVSYGDTGAAVAAVQREVGVDDDGIFGPITRGAVERFQQRYGLPVTGEVDARTWTALFHSNVTFVGGGGSHVMTVYRPGGAETKLTSAAPESSPRSAGTTTPASAPRHIASAPRHVASATPAPAPAAPRPVSAPVSTAGGCGAGRIATPVSGPVTGQFGESRPGHLHAGMDISAASGTPVRAAQCGTVVQAGTESGYGNIVCIQHAGGVSTCYAHLSQIGTSQGSYVHVGDVIGRVGCTGSCTGPHLHFEVRQNGKAVNPEPYLSGSAKISGGATATTAVQKTTTSQTTTTTATMTSATPASQAPAGQPATITQAQPAATAAAPAEGATIDTTAAAPAATAPAPAGTAPAAPTQSAPAPAPAPAETAPAAPAPTQSAPAPAPAPAETTPAPAPAAPAPTQSAPAPAPAPAETAPAPAPAAPAPAQSAPAPAQAQPEQTAPAPAPAQAESAPAEAAAPAEPAPAASSAPAQDAAPAASGAPAEASSQAAATGGASA